MTNFTKIITWNNGHPRFNPPAGVTPLQAGDAVTVRLTGAPSNIEIDWVTIFANQVVNGQDQKNVDDVVCEWVRPGGNCEVYAFTTQSPTEVTITDQDHPAADDKYWFSVGGNAFGTTWAVDPELINHPDRGGGG